MFFSQLFWVVFFFFLFFFIFHNYIIPFLFKIIRFRTIFLKNMSSVQNIYNIEKEFQNMFYIQFIKRNFNLNQLKLKKFNERFLKRLLNAFKHERKRLEFKIKIVR